MNLRLTVIAAAATAATSVALYPLIAGMAWFWAGVGAIIVAAVAGAATRLRVIPAAACFLAALAGEFLFLNALFAGRQSWGRLVPTRASTGHLGHLVAQAITEAGQYAPPVPAHHGVVLLAAGGTGLVAATTDLLAVRLRRPAIAGLPLLVLFCAPLTTGAGSGGAGAVVVFCLSVAGYLALLSSDGRERLRLWGRVVRSWHGTSASRDPDTRQLAASGRRIGLVAVVLAVALPLLLPSLTRHRLFASSSGVGAGSGPVSVPGPLVQLNNELHSSRRQVVLTYRTIDTSPPYLQVYVLDRLGTDAWTLSPRRSTVPLGSGPLPAVPGVSGSPPAVTVHETVSASSDLTGGALPVPYAPRSVSVPGHWRVSRDSLTIFGVDRGLAGLRYTVTSRELNPSSLQLSTAGAPPGSLHGYLTYPAVFTQLKGLARTITKGHPTAIGKAIALQDWFTEPGRFTYTLDASEPHSADALINFLTRNRRGYCQQFAFAMAVLARLVGIPSRVAVGYTQGTYKGHDTWQVTNGDAHAWPELYFAGYGWLGFEPTPGSDQGGQATATIPAYAIPPVSGVFPNPRNPHASAGAATSPSGTARSVAGLHNPLQSGKGSAPAHHPHSPPIGDAVVALVALALAAPRTMRSLTRRRRWLAARDDTGRAHAAWREFCDDLADHRIVRRPSESPRAVARRLSETLDLAQPEREALGRIAFAEERARFAARPVPFARPHADVAAVRRGLARSSPTVVRWAARLVPASVLARARAGLREAADVVGWVDAAGIRRRRRAARNDDYTAYSWRG